MNTPADERSPRTPIILALALFGMTLAVFARSASWDFIDHDDPTYVTENPHVQPGLNATGLRWALTTFHGANWHPLTWISLQLDAQLHGLDPRVFHFHNALLHALSVLILFVALRRMTGAVWRSAFVAALFAVHPLHVESVAWVSERKDVLSGLFWMLALWAYARYVEQPGLARYALVFGGFALGLAAKPMVVTFPCVLLLLDYWPLARFSVLRPAGAAPFSSEEIRRNSALALVLEKVPLFVLSALSCVLTLQAQRAAVQTLAHVPLALRLQNVAVSYCAYLLKTIWPMGLAVFYPLPKDPLPAWQVAVAVTFLAAVSIAAYLTRRKFPYVIVGWLWYLGTLVPVIGILQVGAQSRADRYTYLPLIGIFLLVSWGAADIAKRWGATRQIALLGGSLVAACVVLSWMQLGCWRDRMSLWGHAVDVDEDDSLAHTNLGAGLEKQEKFSEAMKHYAAAIRIDGDVRAHYKLGALLAKQGKYAAAIPHFQAALHAGFDDVQVHNALGAALMRVGAVAEAADHFRAALRLDGRYYTAHYNLGLALESEGKVDEAAVHYEQALQIKPDYTTAARALSGLAWRIATSADPRDVARGPIAVECARTASAALAHREPEFLQVLAAAFAQAGVFDQAVTTAQQALALTKDRREEQDAARRLQLYRAHRACRDESPIP